MARFSRILMILMLLPAAACVPLTLDGKNGEMPGSAIIEQEQSKEAAAAFDGRDYVKAATLYGTLVENYPANVGYRLKSADSLRLAGDPAKARSIYDAVLADAPADSSRAISALEGKGLCFMQEANFKEATKVLSTVLAKDAMRWKTINALGVTLSLSQRTKEAIEYYQLALQLTTNQPAVLNNMGLTYALAGDFKKGSATLEKAIAAAVGEQKKPIALNLALVYGISGRMGEAEKVSTPYLTKAAIYNNLGYYAMLANDKALSRSYLEKALATSSSHYQKAFDNMQKVK
jgi:Flp pilus assembly protein TadD